MSTTSSFLEMEDLKWFHDQMSKTYELKVQDIGWDHDDETYFSFLGRVIRATPTGVEIEGDDKHVEMLENKGTPSTTMRA